jgi:MOSC domain-containing protein YiiM
MAKIVAVCQSKDKGTRKQPQQQAVLTPDWGMVNDAHASEQSHRQVSLLAVESINKMRNLGFELNYGDFAENLTTEGIEVASLPIGTRLTVGKEVVLEITQIGKECHQDCAIRQQMGDCIMPREGVFARVINGGSIQINDEIKEIGR